MAINVQTLPLKLSLTLPLLITQSVTTLRCSGWLSKLLKIEGIGQIGFRADQLLLKQSEDASHECRPACLHLLASLIGQSDFFFFFLSSFAFERRRQLPEPKLFRIVPEKWN